MSEQLFPSALSRLRTKAGVSQKQLAARTGWSAALLSAHEHGRRNAHRAQVEAYDAALDAGGSLVRVWVSDVDAGSGLPEWFRDIARLESEANEIREYQGVLVPGLVQTPDYARAVLSAGRTGVPKERIDAEVTERGRRSERVLTPGRSVWFVIDHVALLRPVGGAKVMRAQIERLIEIAEARSAGIQILPLSAPEHPAQSGAFRIMCFPDRERCAYVEYALGGLVIDDLEFVQELNGRFAAAQAESAALAASVDLLYQLQESFNA